MVVVSSVAHTFSKVPIKLDDLTFKKKNFKPIDAYAQSKVIQDECENENVSTIFIKFEAEFLTLTTWILFYFVVL